MAIEVPTESSVEQKFDELNELQFISTENAEAIKAEMQKALDGGYSEFRVDTGVNNEGEVPDAKIDEATEKNIGTWQGQGGNEDTFYTVVAVKEKPFGDAAANI